MIESLNRTIDKDLFEKLTEQKEKLYQKESQVIAESK